MISSNALGTCRQKWLAWQPLVGLCFKFEALKSCARLGLEAGMAQMMLETQKKLKEAQAGEG